MQEKNVLAQAGNQTHALDLKGLLMMVLYLY